MTQLNCCTRTGFAALLSCAVAVGWTSLSSSAQDQQLPSGETVLAKHIEATGGQAAYDKINNRVSKATMEIANAGLQLDLTIYAAKPNKVLTVAKAPELGEIRQGIDGKAAWSLSDMQGPIVEEGEALQNRLRDALFDRLVYWKKVYDSADCTGVEDVEGKACYVVALHAKDAPEGDTALTVYIDKQDYLPRKVETEVVTEVGTLEVTALFDDYKKVDGLLLPHKASTEVAGQQRIITTESIEHNVSLPEDQFDPPEEIQALLKK